MAMSPKTADQPTAVYRLYDADDRLIYVGQSQRMGQRMRTHSKHSWWYELFDRIEVEYHPTRAAAMAAEATAIQEEQPAFNAMHTGRKEGDWSHLTEDEVAIVRRRITEDPYMRVWIPRHLLWQLVLPNRRSARAA